MGKTFSRDKFRAKEKFLAGELNLTVYPVASDVTDEVNSKAVEEFIKELEKECGESIQITDTFYIDHVYPTTYGIIKKVGGGLGLKQIKDKVDIGNRIDLRGLKFSEWLDTTTEVPYPLNLAVYGSEVTFHIYGSILTIRLCQREDLSYLYKHMEEGAVILKVSSSHLGKQGPNVFVDYFNLFNVRRRKDCINPSKVLTINSRGETSYQFYEEGNHDQLFNFHYIQNLEGDLNHYEFIKRGNVESVFPNDPENPEVEEYFTEGKSTNSKQDVPASNIRFSKRVGQVFEIDTATEEFHTAELVTLVQIDPNKESLYMNIQGKLGYVNDLDHSYPDVDVDFRDFGKLPYPLNLARLGSTVKYTLNGTLKNVYLESFEDIDKVIKETSPEKGTAILKIENLNYYPSKSVDTQVEKVTVWFNTDQKFYLRIKQDMLYVGDMDTITFEYGVGDSGRFRLQSYQGLSTQEFSYEYISKMPVHESLYNIYIVE